jgi:hypothetical protein
MIDLSSIDVITYPGLHLAIDWGRVIVSCLGFDLALGLAGAILGWFMETFMGIIGGGVVLTLLLLVANLVISILSKNSVSTTTLYVVTAVHISVPLNCLLRC